MPSYGMVSNVPVLLVQMVVAQPIVSHASKLHTRFGNRIIVLDEKTSANVTTRRKPFDTTTSRNDITITKYPISSFGTSPLINRPTLISFSVSHSPVYSLISIRNPSSPNCACLYLCNSWVYPSSPKWIFNQRTWTKKKKGVSICLHTWV